ncbi:MAG TPA: amino acid-binding protein [Armatimonadota bacterium]|nr:amino acid-binding protein [Armatimonadota bacterium]
MSSVQQVSVFLENKCGQLADVLRVLSEAGINLGALSIADTAGFGILRFLCGDPARAAAVLREAGFSVGETEVVAVWVPHRPGGLSGVTEVLRPLGINIDYLYSFRGPDPGSAVVVLRVENGRDAQAMAALRQAGLQLLTAEEANGL